MQYRTTRTKTFKKLAARAKKSISVNTQMTECPTMFAFNTRGQVVAVPCGLWTCPKCAKTNANLWAWRVQIHIIQSGQLAYFWTFTLGSAYKTPQQGFKALPRLWDNLRKYLQRTFGQFDYCAFVEGQPKRAYMPHFHVIVLRKSPIRIKDMAV